MRVPKGGSNAAFFLLFAVATLGFGGSLQPPLAVLRTAGFAAAVLFLRRQGKETLRVSPYMILVGGFVALCLGHAFSSVYVWVSLQHAVNIALAFLFLSWALLLFRAEPGKTWETAFRVVTAIAALQVGIALYQRFAGGDLRPHGTFDNPNFLSEFLVAAAILCMARLLWEGDRPRFRRWETAGIVVFLATALSLAESRGVLFAAVPAFGFLLVDRKSTRLNSSHSSVSRMPSSA